MIEPGTYQAKAIKTSAEWGFTQNGNEYLQLGFEVVDTKERVTSRFFFTDKTKERSIESLRYCGCTFPDEDITNMTGLGDRLVSIVVEHEEYNGKVYPRVKWVNSGGPRVSDPMTASDRESFKARLRGSILASKSTQKAPPAPTVNEADIPF